jgi:pilus assembly protein CpaF
MSEPTPSGVVTTDPLIDAVCSAAATRVGPVRDIVIRELDRLAPLTDGAERTRLIDSAVARLDGLDALERHLTDPLVDEIIVNRGCEVWIERDGQLMLVDEMPEGAIDIVLQRVLAPLGRRLDRTTPVIDARLVDGSRLCAAIAPVAVDGTTVSIRRHRLRHIPLSSFAPAPVVELVEGLVVSRANVLVTGATSSGKTTLLAALLAETEDRCVVIEDTAELDLPTRHVVRLEARPATVDGIAAIDADQLVRTALRLRPDRLVIGEFRGNEALAAVQALNTGHDGSLATCHANSALDGLRRLEGLVLQASPSWPLAAIRRQVTRSIDTIIHVERRGVARRIAEIVEPVETDAEPSGRVLVVDEQVVASPERHRR